MKSRGRKEVGERFPVEVGPGRTKAAQASSLSRLVDRWIPVLFPAPALLMLVFLLGFPLFYVINMSFHEWSLSSIIPPDFIGLDNYITALTTPRFWNALWVTAYFATLAVGGEVIFGVFVALLVNREFWGKSLVRVILIVPMTATPVALSLIWSMMLEPSLGIANYVLGLVGLPPQLWAADINLVVPTLALIDIWFWTPFIALIVMAGLQGIPNEVMESARIDGARGHSMLFRVTLPLIKPHIVMAAVLRVIPALKTFDQIYVITGGGPLRASETLNLYVFFEGFEFFHLGYASALAVLLLLVILLTTVVLSSFRTRGWTY